MKRLFNILVAAVMFLLPTSGWSAYIDHGDWAVGSNWDIGHVPVPADGTLYVGPNANGTYNVTVSTVMPVVQNKVFFGNIVLDVTGTLQINDPCNDTTAGNYRTSTINVSSSGYFEVGPDRFHIGYVYPVTINVSNTASIRTHWPYLYGDPARGGIQVNLSGDAVWQTTGLWFPESMSFFPTVDAKYHVNIVENGQFQISSSIWTLTNAQTAIANGFFTGNELVASTSSDGYYTVVSTARKAAQYPLPANGSDWQPGNLIFNWTKGPNAGTPVTYNVYFGVSLPLTTPVATELTATTYDPLGSTNLLPDTTYYWRIDSIDSTGTHTGEVWKFKTQPAPATLAWYKFDGNANCQINILNNGIDGSVPTVYSTGINGQAANFNAGNPEQSIQVANVIGSELKQCSFSFWIYPRPDNTPPGIILGTDDYQNSSALIYSGGIVGSNGKMAIAFAVIGNSPQEVWIEVNPNLWSHVVINYDAIGKTCLTFVNGLLVDNTSYASAAGVVIGPLNFGALYTSMNGYEFPLDGMVDDLRIFNYQLSELNTASLYTNFKPGEKLCILSSSPALDLNDDCVVDFEDFALFAENWLNCTMVPDCNFQLPQ